MRAYIDSIGRVLAFSTATPLGAAGVYTSPTIDVMSYKTYSGLVTSDQAGTYMTQHSHDGLTWYNGATTASSLAANGVVILGTNVVYRYLRIVYTNGATLQGTFQMGIYICPL